LSLPAYALGSPPPHIFLFSRKRDALRLAARPPPSVTQGSLPLPPHDLVSLGSVLGWRFSVGALFPPVSFVYLTERLPSPSGDLQRVLFFGPRDPAPGDPLNCAHLTISN